MHIFKNIAGLGLGLLLGASAMAAPEVSNADLKKQVFEAERGFAATMKARDHAAFARYLSDEAVFFGGANVLTGKDAVAKGWKGFYEGAQAPFSWEPDSVEVLASGTLAISGGPVYDENGKLFARFSSIWRLEAPGKWRIIFDRGWQLNDCKKQ